MWIPVNFGIFFAAFGISLLELSEAGAVTAIYQGIYRGFKPVLYAIAGVLLVLIPTFTVGRYIIYLPPLDYVLAVSSVILFYFGYRLLRSARRYFKRTGRGGKGGEEERGGDLAVVFTVSAIEAFEAALVLIALIPRSYSSTLIGTLLAAAIVVILTAVIKDQIAG